MANMFSTFTNYFIYEGPDIHINNITGFSLYDVVTLKLNDIVIFSESDISIVNFGIMKGKIEISMITNNKKTIYYTKFAENNVNMTIIPYLYSIFRYGNTCALIQNSSPKIISHFFSDACFIGFVDDPDLLVISGEMDTNKLGEIIKLHNIKKIKLYGFSKLLNYLKSNTDIICINYINE